MQERKRVVRVLATTLVFASAFRILHQDMIYRFIFALIAVILSKTTGFQHEFHTFHPKSLRNHAKMTTDEPKDLRSYTVQNIRRWKSVLAAPLLAPFLQKVSSANAIGSLYEFKDQTCLLHALNFNVESIDDDIRMFLGLFQSECKELRRRIDKERATSYIGFGPDALSRPDDFYPGVSSFLQYGGHGVVTLTSLSPNDAGAIEIPRVGNGLQFVKIGAETLRLSKGIENGAKVKYGYGWIELDTPSGIPLQVVVGSARDPIMASCINVNNLQESSIFCKEVLGMSEYPYPLARTVGSKFEPPVPLNSVYMSYSADSMGIVLSQRQKKDQPLDIGSVFQGYTIIADDEKKDPNLPEALKNAMESRTDNILLSPDGYAFRIVKLSDFEKTTSKNL